MEGKVAPDRRVTVAASVLSAFLVAAGLSAGSHVLALGASHEGAMTGLLQLLTLPVLLLSGIMIPLTFAPGWMQAIATVNPLAHVVTGTRELFAGRRTLLSPSRS